MIGGARRMSLVKRTNGLFARAWSTRVHPSLFLVALRDADSALRREVEVTEKERRTISNAVKQINVHLLQII